LAQNLIIACAASRSLETVSKPTLFGHGEEKKATDSLS
jgi:hypothetical protein